MPRDVLRMTLREFFLYADGVGEYRREEYRKQIAVAHLSARLQRAKKIGPLKNYLPREPYAATAKERGARVRSMIERLARSTEITTTKRTKANV